ncbi:MAG: Bug family tripartite tricarboxylate transporter substrate binding protein [Comamonas sp.]
MVRTTRRHFTSWLAATAASSGALASWAQAAPLPQLRIVIPANEGGGWDQTGRALGAALLDAGAVARVDYENIGGKGGTIGLARYVEKYDADPNALLMGGTVMVGAVALQQPAVDLSRIAPLARLTSDYEMLVVKSDSPIKTPKDLIAKMRADAAATPIAGGSAGGIDHMFAGLLARAAGKPEALVYQPFAGGAQVMAAVESGKAVAGISGYSEFSEHLASGKLRAIGVSSKQAFLGVPSVRQQGVDADIANWRGVFTGKAVPAPRQAALLDAVRRAVATEGWTRTLKRNNWDNYWTEGRDFQSFLELDLAMANVLTYVLKLKA